MKRSLLIALALAVLSVSAATLVYAQVQPLIVFIGRSILGGFASGVAHKAGEEFYERARANAPNDAPRPSQVPSYPPTLRSSPTPYQPPVSAPNPPIGPAPEIVPPYGFRFGIRNQSGSIIGVQLYARDRPNVWPSAQQAYLFRPGDHFVIRARCVPGEIVCFGAWSQGRYWGVGFRRSRPCTACCRQCGSSGGVNLR